MAPPATEPDRFAARHLAWVLLGAWFLAGVGWEAHTFRTGQIHRHGLGWLVMISAVIAGLAVRRGAVYLDWDGVELWGMRTAWRTVVGIDPGPPLVLRLSRRRTHTLRLWSLPAAARPVVAERIVGRWTAWQARPPLALPNHPVLTTARLVLRPWVRGEWSTYHRLFSDAVIAAGHGYPVQDSLRTRPRFARLLSLQQTPRPFAVYLVIEHRGAIAGHIDLWITDTTRRRARVGYTIFPEHAGAGLATEALRAVVEVALDRWGVEHLDAVYQVGNAASHRVLEKVGFADAPLDEDLGGDAWRRAVWPEAGSARMAP